MNKLKDLLKQYPGMFIIIGIMIIFTTGYAIYMGIYNSKKQASQEIYETISQDILSNDADEAGSLADESTEALTDEMNNRLEEFLSTCGDKRDTYESLLVDVNIDFDELHALNEDIVGYLVVPDSLINYPILYKEDEVDYYLNTNIDGSKGFPGCIYIENYNNSDFNDALTILYGHNMLNDTMFGMLPEYNKADWRSERPYFVIYTESAILVYCVELCSTYSDQHLLIDNFHKDEELGEWVFDGLTDQDAINARSHIEGRGAGSAYIAETEWTKEDNVVAMSTCGNEGERYIVAGRLVFTWTYSGR